MRDDLSAALAAGPSDPLLKANILISLAVAESDNGDLRAALRHRQDAIEALERTGRYSGRIAVAYGALAKIKSDVGDMEGALSDLRTGKTYLEQASRNRRGRANPFAPLTQAYWLHTESWVARNQGRYEDAIATAREGLAVINTEIAEGLSPETKLAVYSAATTRKFVKIDLLEILALSLLRQDRYAEAEIAARDAIKLAVSLVGRNSTETARTLSLMIWVLSQTGRLAEARTLAEIAIDIYERLKVDENGHALNAARHMLVRVLVAEGHPTGALDVYGTIANVAGGDDLVLDRFYRYDLDRAVALLVTDRISEAAEVTGPAVLRLTERLGRKHFETALATGLHGVTLHRQGDDKAALTHFRSAFEILTRRSRKSESDGASAGRDVQLRLIHDAYLEALATSNEAGAAEEAFRVATFASSRSVQAALAQSAARASVGDPELKDLVRREQDAQKQIAALYGILSDALVEGGVAGSTPDRLRQSIDDLRTARAALMQEIEARFPQYASLINPKPGSIAEIRTALRHDEAMLATYVGRRSTFVWAFRSSGEVAFSVTDEGWNSIREAVNIIRASLTPAAEILGDIPAFDVAAAHRLYTKLLRPVAAGWQPVESLIVVAHGPLGYLPFALLPTAPSDIGAEREPLFSRYAEVPWLIRSHSVAILPSANALTALRGAPPRDLAQSPFAGFGDPLFGGKDGGERTTAGGGQEQSGQRQPRTPLTVTAAANDVKTRGIRSRGMAVKLRAAPKTGELGSAQLAMLPQLPETADEILRIAEVLKADPARDVFIGKAATESAVKSMDLSDYRVIAFATHGLVPGDLDGLTQPALALSSPAVVSGDEDGLLTLGEILELKLDSDWVVLSACNTGAGEGAGAEAVSGLGRAFFYAGTRALLVSN